MNTWKKLVVGAIILSVVLSAILIPNCACEVDVSVDKTEELLPVEIREYQGENLSSINDFLENWSEPLKLDTLG